MTIIALRDRPILNRFVMNHPNIKYAHDYINTDSTLTAQQKKILFAAVIAVAWIVIHLTLGGAIIKFIISLKARLFK